MSGVTMLCYNVNPQTHSAQQVFTQFQNLGYSVICSHDVNNCEILASGECMILFIENRGERTGFNGFMLDSTLDSAKSCEHSNLGYITDPRDNRVYAADTQQVADVVNQFYKKSPPTKSPVSLKAHLGLVYDHCDEQVLDFYQQLGFRTVVDKEHFLVLMCSKNKFHLIFNKQGDNSSIISDFVLQTIQPRPTCAYYASKRIPAAKFDLDERTEKIHGIIDNPPPKHVVKSWDFALYGKGSRYVVDNYYINPVPCANLMITYRHSYNSVCLENLSYFHSLGDIHES